MGTVTQHHWLGKLKFIQHFCQGLGDNVLTLFIPTHNMLALLCVSSLALVAGRKLDGAKFGSKSSYFTVANQDTSSLENYAGCEPLMMWMYIRHGSRNPGDDEILEMTTLLPELRDRIVAAADAGEGSLTFLEVKDLKNWTLDLAPEDDKLLTDSGKLEALEMGKRWKQRLPNFLGDQNNVDSRASYKSRTIETGNSFLEGMGFEQSTYVDNEKSIYYKNEFGCDRYEQEVYDNDNVTEAEAIRFTESQVWTDMLEGVSQRTGVQVTPAEARLAHKMCKYQLAWEPERYTDANYTTAEYPPWCNIFTKEDMALWEFEGDLESHYGAGPAFEITTMAPHKLFDEIYSLIDAHEFDGERPNASAVLTFGHSGGIKPIINAFEIFRDDRNLTAEDFGTDYKWKISNLGTFASNIGLIMYSCSGDYDGAETKVMLVHNEHVVEEQPACGETLCSVSDFKAYYQHIVDFDWDTECPVPEPENATSTTGAGDNDTEVINIINIVNIVSGDGSTEAGETNSEDNHEDNTGGEDSDEDDSDEDDSDEDDSDEDDSDEDESDEDDSSEEEKDKDNKKCHKKKKCQ